MPSSSIRKATPSAKPPAAGIQPIPPAASASSMAGISSDQTDAAIITPAAKPKKIRCAPAPAFFRNKNTTAAPSVVIRNVKPVPPAAHFNASNIKSTPLFC